MHLFTRSIGLLAIVVALAFAGVGTAAAATATVSPGGSTRGVGTTGWELTATGGARFNCANGSFSANLFSATGSLPLTISTSYQQAFSSCRTSGLSYTFQCAATAQLSVTALTNTSGVTPGTVSGLNCVARLSSGCSAQITGSLPVSFSNPGSTLTVPIPGQAIVVSGSTCGSLFPNGPATFAATGGGPFTYVVSPATTINVV
jgi:hypothetical protein